MKTTENPRFKTILIKMTDQEWNDLRNAAEYFGKTKSDILRQAIKIYNDMIEDDERINQRIQDVLKQGGHYIKLPPERRAF